MKLYVGNLSFKATENDLQDLFSQHGAVSEVHVVLDRVTARSRGFAFVTMADAEGGKAAISALDGQDFQGRKLAVNEARPPEPRSGGGGGGGGGFGGHRGGHGHGGGGGRGGRGDRRDFGRGRDRH